MATAAQRFEDLGYRVFGYIDPDSSLTVLEELEAVRDELLGDGYTNPQEWMEVLHNTYPDPCIGVKVCSYRKGL